MMKISAYYKSTGIIFENFLSYIIIDFILIIDYFKFSNNIYNFEILMSEIYYKFNVF